MVLELLELLNLGIINLYRIEWGKNVINYGFMYAYFINEKNKI